MNSLCNEISSAWYILYALQATYRFSRINNPSLFFFVVGSNSTSARHVTDWQAGLSCRGITGEASADQGYQHNSKQLLIYSLLNETMLSLWFRSVVREMRGLWILWVGILAYFTDPTIRLDVMRKTQTIWSLVKYIGLRPLSCWNHGFESRWGHNCFSFVFICRVVLCR
jgi:hypothetical protein